MRKIIKRDNKVVNFDLAKITSAVMVASTEAGRPEADAAFLASKVVVKVLQFMKGVGDRNVSIAEVQTVIENSLMQFDKDVARHYIQYRHDRDQARELRSDLHRSIVGLVDETNKEIMNENANKNATQFHTQRDLLAGIISKHYAMNYLLPKEVAKEHARGGIHFHDLDYHPMFGMTNCCLVDLKGMLERGFKLGNAVIEPPKSIQTAATIVSQIAMGVASSQYGGISFNRLDEVLAPYARLSYMKHLKRNQAKLERSGGSPKLAPEFAREDTEKEIYDAMQTLEYQVNTMYSTQGQTPFLTVNFGLGTSWEAKLIQKAILQNRLNGLGRDKVTAIFPKLVFGIRDGINHKEGDPNYDVKQLALECAASRMYPDILNYDKLVEITGGYKAPMGCRSFLGTWHNASGEEVYDGRNNLGVVSVNLPMVALDAGGDREKFWQILDQYVDVAKQGLDYRLQRLGKVQAKSAPLMYCEGALGLHLDPEEYVLPHLNARGSSISLGYIGINETVNALFGNETKLKDSAEKQAFGLEIVKYLKAKTDAWKKQDGWGWSLYGTPAESLCDRFCKAIVKQYGEVDGVTERGYLTNSFHVEVGDDLSPFQKIDIESQYPQFSTGGFISYTEWPNLKKNLQALEAIWDYTYTRVPYYGTNTPIDTCFKCSFGGEFNCTSKGFVCPKCGNHDPASCQVTRRVCGYLGNPDKRGFCEGKQKEVARRVKHS